MPARITATTALCLLGNPRGPNQHIDPSCIFLFIFFRIYDKMKQNKPSEESLPCSSRGKRSGKKRQRSARRRPAWRKQRLDKIIAGEGTYSRREVEAPGPPGPGAGGRCACPVSGGQGGAGGGGDYGGRRPCWTAAATPGSCFISLRGSSPPRRTAGGPQCWTCCRRSSGGEDCFRWGGWTRIRRDCCC